MNTKMSRRQKDIKSKLMAAIAMLLVSSIMMVSTTYAWFTLSTAPEVTGISTSVGANGNLEMALLPTDGMSKAGTDYGITSGTNDGTLGIAQKNVTWGNLVDLSSNEIYGLNLISLYPSALDIGDNKDEVGNPTALKSVIAPLQTPEYGADGRMSGLKSNTMTATYEGGFSTANSDKWGVRAVGSASGMSTRQLDYRNALSTGGSAMTSAITAAKKSLTENGDKLTNIALAKATNGTFEKADIDGMIAMIDGLLGTDPTKIDGALDYIQMGYNQYMLAIAASAQTQELEKNITEDMLDGVTGAAEETTGEASDPTTETSAGTTTNLEVVYGYVSAQVNRTDLSQEAILDDLIQKMNNCGVSIGNLGTCANSVKQMRANVEQAKTALSSLTDYKWENIKPALDLLIKIDDMTINGTKVSEALNNKDELISSVMSAGGVNLTMPTGSGIYADISDHCGDYNVTIKVTATLGGYSVKDFPVNMLTDTSVNPVYLNAVRGVAEVAKSPTKEGSTEVQTLSEMYGYVIDLAFRTNAASSNLLLQTEPTGRVYEDNKSAAETMGHGSTMTFKGTDGFEAEMVANLMEHIRIVFFDPNSGAIFGTAKLNMTAGNYTIESDGLTVTANINMYEIGTGELQVKYVEIANAPTGSVAEYVAVGTNSTEFRKAGVGTHVYDDVAGTYVLATGDTVGTHVADATDPSGYKSVQGETATHVRVEEYENRGQEVWLTNSTTDGVSNAVITDLTQNTAKAVSVLVYLDGESITNADVATGASSATGTMNLQFASSANLVPMNYANLMGTGTAVYSVTAPSGIDGVSYAATGTKAIANAAFTFNLTNSSEKAYTVSYKIGDGEAVELDELAAMGTEEDAKAVVGRYTIPAAAVTGDVTILLEEVVSTPADPAEPTT